MDGVSGFLDARMHARRDACYICPVSPLDQSLFLCKSVQKDGSALRGTTAPVVDQEP